MIDKNLKYIVSQRIVELRKKSGLKLEQLAYQSGISKGGLSEIERGMKLPRLDILIRICVTLKITLTEFFDFDSLSTYMEEL